MKKHNFVTEWVSIGLTADELAILCNVLNSFLNQSDEVYKAAGIKTKEQEDLANSLHARLDEMFWRECDEHTMLKTIWDTSIK